MRETQVYRFEPYFLAWDSVLHYPHPEAKVKERIYGYEGNEAMIPCWQHKTCHGLRLADQPAPPRMCPNCHMDTTTEVDPDATPPQVDKETGLLEEHNFYKPNLSFKRAFLGE